MSKRVSRRDFLRTVVISAGAASLGPSLLTACDGASRPLLDVFPQSVASGDPRPDSIVLWTRALPEASGDAAVTIELATDAEFTTRFDLGGLSMVSARADHDHCLRVKVTGLEPGTTYYYRFDHAGTSSRTGRFRTAVAPGADVPTRFAVVSCQDYSGRYYNSYLRLLDGEHEDLAFVLHLGDYIYETTADPGFMISSEERRVAFSSPDEALPLSSGDSTFFAARSVGNYRDLYKLYRSDPVLQQVHEKFAFISVWDDHEFSDDCYGDTATYSDGALVEQDRDRRIASEMAFFEYMPVAVDADGDGSLTVNPAALFPNTRLYRSFRFGQHCTLAVTDYRSFRPDHPTPEDAYPGAVILDEAQTRAALAQQETDGDLPDGVTATMAFDTGAFRTYVDLEDGAFADHKRALEVLLTAGYASQGVVPARAAELASTYAQGLTDAAILQATIDAGRAALPADLMGVGAVDPTDPTLPSGLPYALLGKSGLVGQLGARYLTVQRTYELVHTWRTRVNGDSGYDDALGSEQETWLQSTVSGSDATWNLVGNSCTNGSLVLDLSPFIGGLPEGLPPERFYLNVDQWDGFPERRRRLLENIYRPNNCVLLAGDIHGAFASDLGADAGGNRCLDLTTAAISSETFRGLLYRTGSSSEAIRESGLLDPITEAIDGFMQSAVDALKLSESDKHGLIVLAVDGTELRADFHLLPAELVESNFYDNPAGLADRWERSSWRVTKLASGENSELTPVET